MRKCRVWVKTALGALAVVVGGASLVAAQEVSLSNLALKKTYLKTRSDLLELSTSWKSVFSSTAITCPGTSGTCTARIDVSVQFGTTANVGLDDFLFCRVIRSGGVIAPIVALPGDVRFNVSSNGAFQWVFTAVPLGTNAITVQCSLGDHASFPAIFAVKRILTIDVYKN